MSGASDVAVVGGGLVGSAIAYGLLRRGLSVALFDPSADDLHASAGNFGLVWVQGKGEGAPAYAHLTRRSAAAWSQFAQALGDETGHAPAYRRTGGVKVALGEDEREAQRSALARTHNAASAEGVRLLDAAELRDLLPEVGPDATGGTYCADDGHADPLATLTALKTALAASPRVCLRRQKVQNVTRDGAGFSIATASGVERAERVVLCAGLQTTALAAPLGLSVPTRPERGQILVTERQPPWLSVACHTVRQTSAGTVLLGDSKEDVGFDRSTTASVAAAIASRAARMFPRLAHARIIRQWGALRVLTPDGLPIYAEADGAMALTCHSGVTLAAAHAGEVADAIAQGALAARYPAFSPERFARAAA